MLNTEGTSSISVTHSQCYCSYVYDEEVQPTPGVGEIGLESVGDPLENHLYHENIGEHLVCVLQNCLYDPTLLQVDVLKSLFANRLMLVDRCFLATVEQQFVSFGLQLPQIQRCSDNR